MVSCVMCSGTHDLDDCSIYINLSLEDRKQFLIQKRLCFACYGSIFVNHTVNVGTPVGSVVFSSIYAPHPRVNQ